MVVQWLIHCGGGIKLIAEEVKAGVSGFSTKKGIFNNAVEITAGAWEVIEKDGGGEKA